MKKSIRKVPPGKPQKNFLPLSGSHPFSRQDFARSLFPLFPLQNPIPDKPEPNRRLEGRPPVAARKMGNHGGLPLQFVATGMIP
jgi:hypothetical protein